MNVTFQFQNGEALTLRCDAGENLLALARRAGIALDSPCAGSGTCGKCRVKLVSGALESAISHHIDADAYAAGWRLGCRSRVTGECTVFVPDSAGAYRSRLKISDLSNREERARFDACRNLLRDAGIPFSNAFRAVVLTLPPAEDPLPDSRRLDRALRDALGVKQVRFTQSATASLSRIPGKTGISLCAKGELTGDTFRCMAVCPPDDRIPVGCAMDIGTTTVSVVLTDLTTGQLLASGSAGNGQIPYGADVIHRIISQGKPGGIQRLQAAIVKDTLNPLLTGLCAAAGIGSESILRLSVAANTTMNHLLVGVDAQSIRTEPYVPAFYRFDGLTAGDLALAANPAAPVILAPNIGSYVGGDITAGAFAAGLWQGEQIRLFIDLGTNGEIVLGNRDFLIACACSAGPAFEGGDLSCGMRAMDGAVEACAIDSKTLEPTLSVIGAPGTKCAGICGSGMIDLVHGLFQSGSIDPRGKFCRESRRIRRDRHGMARYVLAEAGETETGGEVFVSEADLQTFIHAKAAVYAAIDTLLTSVDMTPGDISRVLVAGGIGSGIRLGSAVGIGMFPETAQDRFSYIGNTSLAGAYALVMSEDARKMCSAVADNMTYLELSSDPGYMDAFVAACFLPHTDSRRFSGNTR